VSEVALAFERFQHHPRLLIDLVFVFASGTAASFKEVYERHVDRIMVGDALRTLIDLHVLTKPSGTRGHYAFDDPMFREWFSKAMSL
jgi:hypothetical protein